MTINQAKLSLEGLSVGDAFGQCFFYHPVEWATTHTIPEGQWHWHDDTDMALSIVEVLVITVISIRMHWRRHSPDATRKTLCGVMAAVPSSPLKEINQGVDWRAVAPALFEWGSYGNGGAMRAAPIGGYYAGDPACCP